MSARLRRCAARDAGVSLVEMLVAIVILGLLGTVIMTSVISTKRSVGNSQQQTNINEEARLAINRMARELRQATSLLAVRNPDGTAYSPTAVTSVTFSADFDGDGCINGVAPTPTPSPAPTCVSANTNNLEVLTYCYDPAPTSQQLVLIPGTLTGSTCTQAGARPILAANVTSLQLSYRSNMYLYDSDGDGITTWRELDAAAAPVGDQDDDINTGDLANIDSVVLDLALLEGVHRQSYRTQIDLRNLS